MLIKFLCGNCQARLKIEYEHAGEKIECPECHSGIRVPDQNIDSGVVIGGFEIKGLIGKGGMGEVYLARQVSMGRDIALKILPAHLTRDKSLVDRFLKEVRNAARLDHPNIVTAYAAGEDDGIYYMAMAYIRGDNLDEILQKGPMEEAEALSLVRQVANALLAAWNEHGMIHRDIKPENIIVDHKGMPKILDMGLSKSMHDSAQTATNPDTIMGSPNYMSPEQIESTDDVDFRADMYSLGTSLYHMLTGTIPFYGGSYIDTLKRQSIEQLADPRTINPDISDACVTFLERLLAKDPDNRFASWDELIEALDLAAGGIPVDKGNLPTGQSMLDRGGKGNAAAGDIDNLFGDKSKTANGQKKKSSAPIILGVAALLLVVGGIGAYNFINQNKGNGGLTPLDPDDPDVAATTPSDDPSQAPATPHPPPPQDDKAREAYSQAVFFAQANPASYDEAIGMFAEIGMDAAGSDYAIRAAEQIERISRNKEQARNAVIQKLRSRVDELINQQQFDEAATFVQTYDSAFALETESVRQQIYERIMRDIEQMENAQEREKQLARLAMARAANKIADHLLDNDVGSAAALLEQTQADLASTESSEPLNQVRLLIQEIQNIPDRVMSSYGDQIGREIDIQFRTDAQKLQIKKLNANNSVTATKAIKRDNVVLGHSTVTFSYGQLSTREVLSKLEGDDPTLSLLRGMVYVQTGSISNARKAFEACGNKVGRLLKHRLDVRLGLAKEQDEGPNAFLDGENTRGPRFQARPGGAPLRGPRGGGTGNRPLNPSPP